MGGRAIADINLVLLTTNRAEEYWQATIPGIHGAILGTIGVVQ